MWRKALLLTAALVFVGFGAVVISLFRWQIVRGEEMSIAALDQSLRSTTLSAMRGTIYDATGKVLAQSASVWTVVLEPAYFADYDDPEGTRQKVASGLAAILDMDEEEVYEKTQGSSYFVYLKRRVETSVRDEINEFLEAEGISSGVRLIEDYKRYYPYGTVASTVLGFTGTDGQGLEGLELQYDTQLRGTAGRLISSRNALGTDMPFEYEQYVEAQDGNNLVLTIDETVQSILEKYLAEGVDQFNVKNGAVAIMMDVNTGAILGLATTPTYDPNDPFTIYDEDLQAQIDALSGEEQDQAFNDAQLKQWRNKAVSDTYYPGSVFKMCTYAMGLEEGVVTEQTTYTCTGWLGRPHPLLAPLRPRPGDLPGRPVQLLQPLYHLHRPAAGGRDLRQVPGGLRLYREHRHRPSRRGCHLVPQRHRADQYAFQPGGGILRPELFHHPPAHDYRRCGHSQRRVPCHPPRGG